MQLRNRLPAALCFVILSQAVNVSATAAPPRNDAPRHLENFGATQEGPVGVPAMLWLDEASRSRVGAATSFGLAESLIFDQPNDSGFGWFLKSDDTLGLGTWAHRMRFSNGWQPGDSFSSYEARIWHSTSDDPSLGGADFLMELWDGDPMGIMETVCSIGGVPAPIPGTDGIIADVPYGVKIQARVELAEKVTYDCDRAWMVMTMLTGCRATWFLSGTYLDDTFNVPPALGGSNGIWMQYPCEAFSECPTPSGRGAGFCCGAPEEVCDHGAEFPTNCSSQAAQAVTFCGDGVVDYFIADYQLPNAEEGYVGSLFAPTDTVLSIVPVSVDAPTVEGELPAGVLSLGGDEVVLETGGHNVWLEIRVGDWDPDDVGVQLSNWQTWFDSSGLTSGDAGSLGFYVGPDPCGACIDTAEPCFSDSDCTPGNCSGSGDPCYGSSVLDDCTSSEFCDGYAYCEATEAGNEDCAAVLGTGAVCGPTQYYLGSGTCGFAYMDLWRPDWVFADATGWLNTPWGLVQPGFPAGAGVIGGPADDPEPFPDELLYGATFVVNVPSDAKGTFTLSLSDFPVSTVDDQNGQPLPLIGIVPGKITIPTGRCCYNLQDMPIGGEGCFDILQTHDSCAQLPGLTYFEADLTCDEPCIEAVCVAAEAPETDFVPGNSGIPGDLLPSAKNRFISFAPTVVGVESSLFEAARVTFVSLPRPYDIWNGHQMWVTQPVKVNENGALVEPTEGSPSFYAASLKCGAPVFSDYALPTPVHVFHEGVVPGGIYEIQLLGQFCEPESPEGFSAPLVIANSQWGDVLGGFLTAPPSAPEGIARVADLLGILARFASVPGSIIKARADLEPACIDLTINVSDAIAALRGFQGLPYSFAPTASSPCSSTCANPLP